MSIPQQFNFVGKLEENNGGFGQENRIRNKCK